MACDEAAAIPSKDQVIKKYVDYKGQRKTNRSVAKERKAKMENEGWTTKRGVEG